MGTIMAVVYANLVVAFIEIRMFTRLPEVYNRDFVEFFINNYFRFLDDIQYKWDVQYDITPLWNILNNLDENIICF